MTHPPCPVAAAPAAIPWSESSATGSTTTATVGGDEDESGARLTEPCYTGPDGTAGIGACEMGVRTCDFRELGGFGDCVGDVVPRDEACNGVDDDCDAQTDEDDLGGPLTQACYTGPRGTEGVGLCAPGVQVWRLGGLRRVRRRMRRRGVADRRGVRRRRQRLRRAC